MVHERDDEYEGQEDGEYHFSDDQANYEMEPEVEKPTIVSSTPKTKTATGTGGGLSQYRRPIIGAGVLFFLIFLIYKIMSPSNAPSVEFTQKNISPAVTKQAVIKKPQRVIEQPKVIAAAPAPALPPPAPVVQQPAPEPSPVVSEAAKTPAITVATTPATPTLPAVEMPPVQSSAPPVQIPGQPIVQTAPSQQAMQSMPAPVVAQPAPGVPAGNEMTSAQTAGAIDKLIALQDQNTRLVNQLQAESAQKIADYEAQNVAMQGKLQDMNMRIGSLEATLTHLTKLMQDIKANGGNNGTARGAEVNEGANQPVAMMATPIVQPRSAFSVQAIIPGRAWLKADNGETITVAEGDIIKNYGRITKIDPYDGIVQIDAAGKVVTLSYGAGTD